METLQTSEKKTNTRLFSLLAGAGIILVILAVLQLTIGTGVDGQGFNWKLDDFIIIGLLLFGTAILCEFVLRTIKSHKMRLVVIVGISLLFILVWIDLAVGIFNISGFSGN